MSGTSPIAGSPIASENVAATALGRLIADPRNPAGPTRSLILSAPATVGDDTIVRRYAEAMERKGELVVLRRVNTGADGLPNPTTLANPWLAGALQPGAVSLSIDAEQAYGRIFAGDRIVIGSLRPIAIAHDAISRSGTGGGLPEVQGFDAVQLATPLPASCVAGTPVQLLWQADAQVWGTVASFPLALQNDQRIAGDYNVTLAAFGVARPQMIDQLVIDGLSRQIVSVDVSRVRGQIVAWLVHAR